MFAKPKEGLWLAAIVAGWLSLTALAQAECLTKAAKDPARKGYWCGPEHTFERAGCPQCIRKHAHPSDTPHYCGYYVGGGAACPADRRRCNEGTWGWDYRGMLFEKRIALDWFHGSRYQGGGGAYGTHGPKILHHE